jgi:hypothetical protein
MLIDYEEFNRLTAKMEDRTQFIMNSANYLTNSHDHLRQMTQGMDPYMVIEGERIFVRLLDPIALSNTTDPCIAFMPLLKRLAH